MGVDFESSERSTDFKSEIKFNDYFVVVRTFGKGSADLDLIDLRTNKFYQIENYVFSQFVSVTTLITGLERKSQEVSVTITRIEDKENGNKLKIQVSVNIKYLHKLEETILLENKPISASDLLEAQLRIASQEIETIKQQLEIAKSKKKYVYSQFNKISIYQDIEIGSFQLPRGVYKLSVYLQATYSNICMYIIILLNGEDIFFTRDDVFTLDQNESSGQLIFNQSCFAKCNNAVNTVSIHSQFTIDHQWEMKNLIITADELPN